MPKAKSATSAIVESKHSIFERQRLSQRCRVLRPHTTRPGNGDEHLHHSTYTDSFNYTIVFTSSVHPAYSMWTHLFRNFRFITQHSNPLHSLITPRLASSGFLPPVPVPVLFLFLCMLFLPYICATSHVNSSSSLCCDKHSSDVTL